MIKLELLFYSKKKILRKCGYRKIENCIIGSDKLTCMNPQTLYTCLDDKYIKRDKKGIHKVLNIYLLLKLYATEESIKSYGSKFSLYDDLCIGFSQRTGFYKTVSGNLLATDHQYGRLSTYRIKNIKDSYEDLKDILLNDLESIKIYLLIPFTCKCYTTLKS